ncbi:MAG: Trk system potassium transport protein TrkA [Candidatus Binatia bacterium]|nr:MAG: Trk system potassium transport protein TrkA [Candidatus Binatia bacterium]
MNTIIVGGGLVGATLAERLAREEHNVTVVERDTERARELAASLDVHVIPGNGATAPVLRRAGIEDAELLIAITDSDETNMVVGLLGATLFHVPRIVVRLRDNTHAEGFELIAGERKVDYVRVNPEEATVDRIFSLLEVPGAVDVASFLGGRLLIAGFRITENSEFAGLEVSTHMKLLFPDTPTLVAAVHRGDDWIIPHAGEEFRVGDIIYFAVPREELDHIVALVGSPPPKGHRVMIAGAGSIGIALARRLEKAGVPTVLVEESADLAEKASEVLDKTFVVRGKPTERECLVEENIERVSTFVAVTGDHEVNLVSSLLAKRLGASRAFALVDNPALVNLIGEVGIDAIISPRALAVGMISQHVRRGRVHAGSALIEEEVDVVEVEVDEKSPLISGTIEKLDLPKGVLVIAVRRGDRLWVPQGQDRLEPGDQALLITATDGAKHLDEYLARD